MKHEPTKAQRLLAEYQRRTARVQAMVNKPVEFVICELCGASVGVNCIGWHRDRHGYPRRHEGWHQLDKNEDRDFGGHG